jgi:Fe-S cluster biogenesis protein NfuA
MGDLLAESSKRVETILDRFSAFPVTTGARTDAEDLVRTVSGLYGEALRRIVATLRDELGERAEDLLERACRDPLVASLLITHGMHPVPLQERVRRGIDSMQPYLQSHDAHVEVLSIDEDVVNVRVQGSSDIVPALEQAIFEAAPEVLQVRAVGQTISLLEAR